MPRAALIVCCVLSVPALAAADGDLDGVLTRIDRSTDAELRALAVELNTADRFSPERVHQLADAMARRARLPEQEAFAWALRCAAHTRMRELATAERQCAEALAVAEQTGGDTELFAVLRQLGRSQLERGRIKAGVQSLLRALRSAERLDHAGAQASVLTSLGGAAYFSFAFLDASVFLERAIEVARVRGDWIGVAGATHNLALMLFEQGRIRPARDAYRQARQAIERVEHFDDTPVAALVWFGEARCTAALGDPAAALKAMKAGFERFEALADSTYLGVANRYTAEAYQHAGNIGEALKHVRTALELFTGNRTRSTEARLLEAQLLLQMGQPEVARVRVEALLAEQVEPTGDRAEALRLRAEALSLLGLHEESAAELKAAFVAHERLDRERNTSRADFVRARFEADSLARANDTLKQLALRDRRVMGLAAAMVVIVILLLVVLFRAKLNQRRLETERERTYRLETIGRLTGGVAHDFNNMLQIILQNVEYLETRPDQADAREVLEETKAAANAGAGIIDKLLTFARQSPHESTDVELEAFLARVRPLLKRTVGDAVELDISIEADLAPVRVDESLFTAALINLVANSRDAMGDRGRVVIAAETVHRDREKWVSVSVRDNGRGIARENQSRLFEPFFTTKPPGGGSGLGLSMVYGFIKDSDGFVDLQSEPGVGTAISLMLPEAA
ncbi:MAG: ATP-binding protein [Myxococcota bacterium]